MKITNCSVCLRPYGLHGKKVHRVYFFNENGVIFNTRSGWIEKSYQDLKEDVTYFGSVDVLEIDIQEPVKKIKKDLSIKKNFYIKAERVADWERLYDLKDEYDLYIYVGDVVKVEKTKELTREEENTTYMATVQYIEYLITGLTAEPFKVITQNTLKTYETKESEQAKEILEILKENRIYCNLDEYSICKMLKVFNITKK